MELLQKIENRGYPTEYLLSRIRGRRAYLIIDWKPFLYGTTPLEYFSSTQYKGLIADQSAEGVWRHLLKEFEWVYLQMNRGLQGIFWPFFQYSELRTLFFSLRYKAGKESEKIEELLAFSLLSERFKEVLKRSENILSAIEVVGNIFASSADKFKGFKEIYLRDGLKEIEQRLANIYLEHTISLKLHPIIRDFFIRLIDMRNIITLYKHLWWNIKVAPSFIKGGSISKARLGQIMEKEEIFEVGSIIHRLTGIRIENLNATNVENSLLKGIKSFLKKAGREPSGIGLILDYLWRCNLEARNLGIILYGKDMVRERLTGELIQ